MPMIGDVKSGWVWQACCDCGRERWARTVSGHPRYIRCRSCANKLISKGNKHKWTGGRTKDAAGYILVWVSSSDFFYPMAYHKCITGGYVLEHRLIMAKHIGRNLQTWEAVHHKDGIKDNNRIENLKLTTRGSHSVEHSKGYKDGYLKGLLDGRDKTIKELQSRVTLLEAENIMIQTQLKSQYVIS